MLQELDRDRAVTTPEIEHVPTDQFDAETPRCLDHAAGLSGAVGIHLVRVGQGLLHLVSMGDLGAIEPLGEPVQNAFRHPTRCRSPVLVGRGPIMFPRRIAKGVELERSPPHGIASRGAGSAWGSPSSGPRRRGGNLAVTATLVVAH